MSTAFVLLLGATWLWGIRSALLLRLVMQRNLGVLPLWVVTGPGYVILSIVNLALLLLMFGLPIAGFFLIPWSHALLALPAAAVICFMAGFLLDQIIGSIPMLRFYLSAVAFFVAAWYFSLFWP